MRNPRETSRTDGMESLIVARYQYNKRMDCKAWEGLKSELGIILQVNQMDSE